MKSKPHPHRPFRPTCRYCGKEILFTKLASGEQHPCEPDLVESDGTRTLIVYFTDIGFKVVPHAPVGMIGRETHFAHCEGYQRPVRPKRPEQQLGLF